MKKDIRILVLDDDLEFIGELAEILETSNIDIKATDSRELMIKRALSLHPDVIVLDSDMESRFHHSLSKDLDSNPNTHDIPVMILEDKTSHGDLHQPDKEYIHKPFRIEQFLRSIQNLLLTRVNIFSPLIFPVF